MLRSKKWIIATILIIGVLWIVFLKENKIEITPIEIQRSFLDEIIEKLSFCESNNKAEAFNPKDSDGKEKFGCMQFDTDTATEFLNRYGIYEKNWQIEDLKNWLFDCEFSKRLAKLMIKDGYIKRWGCYTKI